MILLKHVKHQFIIFIEMIKAIVIQDVCMYLRLKAASLETDP